MKKYLLVPGFFLFFILIVLQFFRPQIKNAPVTKDFDAPIAIKSIIVRACYDCHSNQTNLRWYDQVQPVFSQVASHVKAGRKVLNFSEWNKLSPADRKGKLWEAVNQIEQGAMPIKSYEFVHGDARITTKDLAILKNYLSGMVHEQPNDSTKTRDFENQESQQAKKGDLNLPSTLNHITYIPDYKNWQVISTSDRFDNGTVRVIYGNDIAVKAVKENRINPWPDGTTFAKAAWDKLENEKGEVNPGAFKQVEFMIKDARKFKATNGWGFARFKTPKLTPYGKTAMFTTECISCHKPMKDNDFVFTFPIKN